MLWRNWRPSWNVSNRDRLGAGNDYGDLSHGRFERRPLESRGNFKHGGVVGLSHWASYSLCCGATGAQVGMFQIAIVWGLGMTTAIYLTGALSGAHLNPAVTLSMAVWSDFPIGRVIPYVVAQLAPKLECFKSRSSGGWE